MSLIACPACGRHVSTQAPTCPQCGHPVAAQAPAAPPQQPVVRQPRPGGWGIGGWLLLLLLLLAGGAFVLLETDVGKRLFNRGQQTPPPGTGPGKVAEFKFSYKDLRRDSLYRAATDLTAGKEAWVSVEMGEGKSWAASTPTGPEVDYYVLPQCRLKVSGGKGLPQETNRVEKGFLPETSPGGYFHSFPPNSPVAYGTRARRFAVSHLELRFLPTETGQYLIEFEHMRQPEQAQGFGEYTLRVYQAK